MAGSQVMIVNGTDDDAVCRVSGGSGTPGGAVTDMKWRLPKKQTFAFSIEIGDKATGLKLTKNSRGYKLEVVGNGNGRKPKPKPKPKPGKS